MSKPGKVLKALCKKLGVRLTIKRGKKRVYKSVKVLKAQCKRKVKKKKRKVKKKKVKKKRKVKRKRRRKFGTTISDKDKNLLRKHYIIIGKTKPEEGAMSMYEPIETIYGHGSFDKHFNKNKGLMLQQTILVNNIPTIYNDKLIPIYRERPHLKGDVFYHIEETYSNPEEGFKKFDYEIEGHNFDWYVFNPFNTEALKDEENTISLIEGHRRHKRKRNIGYSSRVNIPIRIKRKKVIIPMRTPPPPLQMVVHDVSDYDSEYDDLEFGKKRRKKNNLKKKKSNKQNGRYKNRNKRFRKQNKRTTTRKV